MGKFEVFSTWMPAFCSPLNGVMTGDVAPGSHPRLNGTWGSLNHRPRWYWWVGANVVVPPGDTEKVSESNTPRTVALPVPVLLDCMSVWYHETPNGLPGCWMTNRSKPAGAMMVQEPAQQPHRALQVANEQRTMEASGQNRKLAAAALMRLGGDCPPEWEDVATEVILHSQYSWSQIAHRLGVTRGQAVYRFRRLLAAAGVAGVAGVDGE